MQLKPANKAFPLSAAIIPAAGLSRRMGGDVRKPFLTLKGLPVLTWALRALVKVPQLRWVVLVTRPEDQALAKKAAQLAELPNRVSLLFAPGGPRRQDSVFNGLKALPAEAELVLIHDAARPFPPLAPMKQAVLAAQKYGASLLAVPVRDTVKRARKTQMALSATPATVAQVEKTVPREALWLAQTPQIIKFKKALWMFREIEKREKKSKQAYCSLSFTDDASICEYFNMKVILVQSSEKNLKITRPEDLEIMNALLKSGYV
jgi:2-C-methyl-D-erythritol 4-phosphate cytidylyltransferase